MVSKANEDLPDPERPVITMGLSRGRTRSRFLRLCSRAPLMMMERDSAIVVHYNRRNRTSQAPRIARGSCHHARGLSPFHSDESVTDATSFFISAASGLAGP